MSSIIFAHNDRDGILSASLLLGLVRERGMEPEIELTDSVHLPDRIGKARQMEGLTDVYIVDLSPKFTRENRLPENLKELHAQGVRINWYDHHFWGERGEAIILPLISPESNYDPSRVECLTLIVAKFRPSETKFISDLRFCLLNPFEAYASDGYHRDLIALTDMIADKSRVDEDLPVSFIRHLGAMRDLDFSTIDRWFIKERLYILETSRDVASSISTSDFSTVSGNSVAFFSLLGCTGIDYYFVARYLYEKTDCDIFVVLTPDGKLKVGTFKKLAIDLLHLANSGFWGVSYIMILQDPIDFGGICGDIAEVKNAISLVLSK